MDNKVAVVKPVNTQEALNGLMALTCKIAGQAKHFKDGFQIEDISNIIKELSDDKEFLDLMTKAFDGITSVPGELKNIGLSDGLSLGFGMLPWVQKLIVALK